jgi:hypothetical protein
MSNNNILEKLRELSWIFILAASALGVCGLLFPVVMKNDFSYDVWMIALERDSDGDFRFNDDAIAVVGAVIETAIVILSVIFLIVLMLKLLKKKEMNKLLKTLLLLSAIFLIVSPVGYSIGASVSYDDFWGRYIAGFGLIAPLIASGIAWFYYTLLVIMKNRE